MFCLRVHGRWLTAIMLALTLSTASVLAQTAELADKMAAEATRLYQAGRYGDAVPLAQQALAIREKALGPDHLDVASTLNTLAGWHRV